MDVCSQQALVERECRAFQSQLDGLIDPEWPVDVRILLKYLHEHLFDLDLQVGEACRACGIRDGRFRRVFKRCCHQTMHRYCRDKRLLVAVRLFFQKDLEIGCIAFGIGYENYRTFGRAFKRCFGQPPGAFREKLRQRENVKRKSLSAGTELEYVRKRLPP